MVKLKLRNHIGNSSVFVVVREISSSSGTTEVATNGASAHSRPKRSQAPLPRFALAMTSLTGYCDAMVLSYSICEAKARFAEVFRRVPEGKIYTVPYREDPVAETRSTERMRKPTLDKRLKDLERSGGPVHSAIPPYMYIDWASSRWRSKQATCEMPTCGMS